MADEAKHEHRYTPSISRIVDTDDGVITVVLLHCECGDFNHSRIPGKWLFEEITRLPQAPEADAQFLQRMGVVSE
jgi:hypothetical protein